ncbi:MAG: glycine/betaine ABC transporter, partial [Spirochaeta sp.]|nr:glycine/betaine ABC transporter [Spirochaeta sp.]
MIKTLGGIAKVTVFMLVVAFAFTACQPDEQEAADGAAEEQAEEKGEVSLVYVNWEEGVAWSHFFATVLEDELGYEVNLTAADVGPAFASVAGGDQDFFMEAWLPGLHSTYVE